MQVRTLEKSQKKQYVGKSGCVFTRRCLLACVNIKRKSVMSVSVQIMKFVLFAAILRESSDAKLAARSLSTKVILNFYRNT